MSQLNWMHKMILRLPQSFLRLWLHRKLSKASHPPLDLHFRISQTKEEYEQAFSLLHKYYVELEKIKPASSGLHLTQYHALPETRVLMALNGTEVVATVTLIPQSLFGLPVQTHCSLKSLPEKSVVVEISNFAVHSKFKQSDFFIFMSLMNFADQVIRSSLGASHIVASLSPSWFYFAQALFGVESLAKANAQVGACLTLEKGTQTPSVLPIHEPMSLEMMKYFFVTQSEAFKKLTDFEKLMLTEIYKNQTQLAVIPKPNVIQFRGRRQPRFTTRRQGYIHLRKERSIQIEVLNASENGLGGMSSSTLPVGPYQLEIRLEGSEICSLRGHLLWQTVQGHFGFSIEDSPADWLEFVLKLEKQAGPESAPPKFAKTGA